MNRREPVMSKSQLALLPFFVSTTFAFAGDVVAPYTTAVRQSLSYAPHVCATFVSIGERVYDKQMGR